MSFNRVLASVLLAAACIGGALACGPNFPWQLFDDRDDAVSDPVGLSFAHEGARLVAAPGDALRNIEPNDPTWYPDGSRASPDEVLGVERREAEADAWRALMPDPAMTTVAVDEKLRAARDAADSDAARAAGAGLPAAVLEYIA